ncbi:hypothetical protein [Litoribrevibacter albus]|uniref:Uncharacterized protein n=1 Tax=Litoribrevibacter albus TaxID=1473156 RepID=A0AA37W795_9GAMM|nr:hypothetical protein [Litoribrevibacter albus]GLQ31064.1 hypothetical protein GCM10007876_15430 [Litoribrevibacter albus]
MSRIDLVFAESELKIILEGLAELEAKTAHICETSDDDDEISDYGNDLIEIRLLLSSLKEKAVKEFGDHILNFSRESL